MENCGKAYLAKTEAERLSMTNHLQDITEYKCQLETCLRQSTEKGKQAEIVEVQMMKRFNIVLQEKEAAERKLAIQRKVFEDKIQDLQETIDIQDTRCDDLTHEAHVWKNGLRDKSMDINQLRSTNTLFRAQLYRGRGSMADAVDRHLEGRKPEQHGTTRPSAVVEQGKTAAEVGLSDENQCKITSRDRKRRRLIVETEEAEEEKSEPSDLPNKKRKWTMKR
nr:hypothetical protein CFP56_11648 [Quercus suber]